MNQFTFVLTKGERRDTVNCTSQTKEKALQAVKDAYSPEFNVLPEPMKIRKAHYFYNEIDATS